MYQYSAGHGFLDDVVTIGPGGDDDSVLVMPFERAEVVVDFSDHAGETFTLTNRAEYPYHGDSSGSDVPELAQIRVADPSSQPGDGSTAPSSLSLPGSTAADPGEAWEVREMSLESTVRDGLVTHLLNGYGFGEEEGLVEPFHHWPEIWEFVNETNHSHPMHMHLTTFRVLGRGPTGTEDPDPAERGPKDTVRVDPDERVRVLAAFDERFIGRYPWHCHMLEHEDNKMMLPFDVQEEPDLDVLVFTATDGFRRDNIPAAHETFRTEVRERLRERTDADVVDVDVVDDAWAFPERAGKLDYYDAVVWFNTTGSPLDDAQQAAFEEYIESGGGYVGVHAAADTHYDWEWYGDLVGAYFENHPEPQEATVNVTDGVHPSTEHLPTQWGVFDEWYDYDRNPRGDVHVLATLDEDTYDGARMEDGRTDHPIAWCHEYRGGRSWYTGRGHTVESLAEEGFLEHLVDGVLWSAGLESGDATGTVWDSYGTGTVADGFDDPTAMAATGDGRLVVAERAGGLHLVEDGATTQVLDVDIRTAGDEGLHGVTADPAFADNGWLYLWYSPAGESVDRLRRVTVADGTVDPGSAVDVLKVPATAEYHAGGGLAFGPEGRLHVGTGDDTYRHEIEGEAPTDVPSAVESATTCRGTRRWTNGRAARPTTPSGPPPTPPTPGGRSSASRRTPTAPTTSRTTTSRRTPTARSPTRCSSWASGTRGAAGSTPRRVRCGSPTTAREPTRGVPTAGRSASRNSGASRRRRTPGGRTTGGGTTPTGPTTTGRARPGTGSTP